MCENQVRVWKAATENACVGGQTVKPRKCVRMCVHVCVRNRERESLITQVISTKAISSSATCGNT